MDELAFFSKYAMNLTAAGFPTLTARRRGQITTDTEVILLGDSHSWGQGSPGFDVVLPTFSAHMSVPYSIGYYARLRKHIVDKYGWYTAETSNRELYHPADGFRTLSGTYRRLVREVGSKPAAAGFYAPGMDDPSAVSNLGYLATDNKFNEDVWIVAPGEDGTALFTLDMKAHASKLYIGFVAGQSGARLEVSFAHRGGRQGNSAGSLYRLSEGYPKVTWVENGKHIPVVHGEAAVVNPDSVVIDTWKPGKDEETVLCIDYGQKQRGRLRLAYAGARDGAVPFDTRSPELAQPAISLRGIVFDGNDVRNFSMGGHTVGQWLGDGTPSFNDPSHPHMEQLLRYVPFTPSLVVIQAPIVNEYIRQTPLAVLTGNLETLFAMISGHLNVEGAARTDFLLLTTPGDMRIAFQGEQSSAITYDDYYEAVREFCSGKGIGLIDFARYFEDRVREGHLDYELLFDDVIHPSPYVNEFIARTLGLAVDLLM